MEILGLDLPVDESKVHTPAYASFDFNTDRLLHLFTFMFRGVQNFTDELRSSIEPQVTELCGEIATIGGNPDKKAKDAATSTDASKRQGAEIARLLSDIAIKPIEEFTSGLLTMRQWIPVILVTTVEAYLKDVRMFEAKVNPAIMESSEQSVTYAEVARSRSIDDLVEEMQSRWARNFVDDGGPARWIDKLTRMGARSYDSQTGHKMEILWGVRHVIVHSAGVATPDFVRRHADFGATVGKSIVIRLDQLSEWIKVVYHFVDVTDSYFAQRYKSECAAFRKQLENQGDTP